MGQPATVIPEKIFFKIGEVCDLVGVQAHVLRYWETEFPMLSPQKNRSGQRTYRRRDVEIALRIKELLYDDLFTIAGAKKRLQNELRDSSRLKIVHPEPSQIKETFLRTVQAPPPPESPVSAPTVQENFASKEENYFDESSINSEASDIEEFEPMMVDEDRSEALKSLASQLLELREMFKSKKTTSESPHFRKY